MRVPQVMEKHRPRQSFARNHAFFRVDANTTKRDDLIVVIQSSVGRILHDRGRSCVARYDATRLDGARHTATICHREADRIGSRRINSLQGFLTTLLAVAQIPAKGEGITIGIGGVRRVEAHRQRRLPVIRSHPRQRRRLSVSATDIRDATNRAQV